MLKILFVYIDKSGLAEFTEGLISLGYEVQVAEFNDKLCDCSDAEIIAGLREL